MFKGNYSFPHPVLGLGDDIEGEFSIDIEVKREVKRTIKFFNFQFEISNQYILDLIESKQAGICLKINCGPTYKTWTFLDPPNEFEIDENEVFSKIELSAYVIANDEISRYGDASFNQEFAGYDFNVSRYDILAVSGKVTLPIHKTDERLGIENIFRFYAMETNRPVQFSYNQDKIFIMYPETKDGKHMPQILFKTKPWTAYNLFIIPALAGAFQLIDDDPETVLETEWYNVISQLFPEELWDDDPYINAQMLLNRQVPLLNVYNELV